GGNVDGVGVGAGVHEAHWGKSRAAPFRFASRARFRRCGRLGALCLQQSVDTGPVDARVGVNPLALARRAVRRLAGRLVSANESTIVGASGELDAALVVEV